MRRRWSTPLFETIHPVHRSRLLEDHRASTLIQYFRTFYEEHYLPRDYGKNKVPAVLGLSSTAVIAGFPTMVALTFAGAIYRLGMESVKPHCSNIENMTDTDVLCEGLRVLYAQKIRENVQLLEQEWKKCARPIRNTRLENFDFMRYVPVVRQVNMMQQDLLGFDSRAAGLITNLEHNEIPDPAFSDHTVIHCRNAWMDVEPRLETTIQKLQECYARGGSTGGVSGT